MILYAFYEEAVFAFAVTLLYGYFADVLSWAPMGMHLVGYISVFAVARYFRSKIPFEGWISRLGWICFLSLLYGGLEALYLYTVADLTRPFFSYAVLLAGNVLVGFVFTPLFRFYQNLTPSHFVEQGDSLLRR